jgi:signal transduction histidine kinase
LGLKSNKLFLILTSFWAFTLLALGSWWLYLLLSFGDKLNSLIQEGPRLGIPLNLINMMKWEGATFLIILLFLSLSLLRLILKDQAKTNSLHAFFASMTHELKTPLASIRLQSDVIKDTIDPLQSPRLEKLTSRMVEDTVNLETQMDKILQLSRIERGGNLNPIAVELESYIKEYKNTFFPALPVNIKTTGKEKSILADEFALRLILNNLYENSIKHAKSEEINIHIEYHSGHTTLTYSDGGTFSGNLKKLGTLFYKHDSSKGSGIGVYLITKLMEKMHGKLEIKNDNSLTYSLMFKYE